MLHRAATFFFSRHGTTSREAYWAGIIATNLIACLALAVLDDLLPDSVASSVLLMVVILASSYPLYALSVKRLRDLGKDPRELRKTFIPIYGLVWWVTVPLLKPTPQSSKGAADERA